MPGPRKKTVRMADGSTIVGTVMPFQAVVENFNEYLLDDGTVMQVKTVITEFLRVDDAYDDQGQPVYLMNSTQLTATNASPENMEGGGG